MKLFKTTDIENFTIDEVHKLYSKYVNKSQVDLISKFGFGKDIAIKAEGNSIFTKKNKKILDFTGGIGVLNHGHNHPKILKYRCSETAFGNNFRVKLTTYIIPIIIIATMWLLHVTSVTLTAMYSGDSYIASW